MKRMKYRAVILLAVVAFFASAGCQKEMDIQRDDRVESTQTIYERLVRVYGHLSSTFYVPSVSSSYAGFSAGGHMMAVYCDEAQEVAQSSAVYNWYDGRASSSSMPLWYVSEGGGTERWTGLFNAIYGCNEALTYLQDENLQIDYEESQRKGLVAQFYALRAYSYLQLIKRWGGVPIVDKIFDKNHDYSQDKRASFAQCVDFILESCDAAMAYTDDVSADGLPWFNSGSQSYQACRLGRAALWSIKSQAVLYAASPLWVDDCAGTQRYTWERAAVITKQALDQALGHGAKLADKTTSFPIESSSGLNAYDKYFLSSHPWAVAWDHETLYQPYNYGAIQSAVWQNSGLPIDMGQISAGACPTQEMVDAYEVLSADGTQSEPLLNLARPYNADGKPNFNPAALALGYKDCSAKMYEHRDPRFYSTIYYDGVTLPLVKGDYVVETAVGGNCALILSPGNKRHTCTGYYLRKFNNASSGTETGNKDGYTRVFRLAELYLNFAEAAFKAYGADLQMAATASTEIDAEGVEHAVTYGVPMSAREAINTVRARVEMPAVTVNGSDFWLRLCNERRVELAFEEHRFFDVRRWSIPEGDLSTTDQRVSGMRIEGTGDKVYDRFNFERRCYTNKFLKFPLSLDEVRKMLNLTGENWQNEGWN
ncbi:MAG: RagB/SusD family nutrient uptake outer membrane protein [Alistipes sp.]